MPYMTGVTASEMAERLSLPLDTIKRRLHRAGRKPFCQEALYTEEDFEVIKNSNSKGWPKGKPRKEKPVEEPKQ